MVETAHVMDSLPACGATLSAHSACPRKIAGWTVPVHEIFCKQAYYVVGFLPGFLSLGIFSKFLVWYCFICYILTFKLKIVIIQDAIFG